MATQLQIRRGTTAQMGAFTGAEGELAVNTSTDTVHVHDGSTAGGFALAKADGSNIGTYAGSFTTISASGAITGNVTGDLTGSVLTAAQTNITSVGTLSSLAVTGAATMGGLTVNAGTDKVVLANNFATTGNTDSPKLAFYSFGDVATYPVSGPSIKKVNTGSYGAGDLVIYQHGPYDFTNEVEALRISSAGSVGIGVSNPSDYYANNLVVGAGSEGGITITSSATTYNSYLAFADSSSGIARYAGLISYEHSTDNMAFRTNSLERMRIDSSGSVGIGCSPRESLEIQGTGNQAVSGRGNLFVSSGGTASQAVGHGGQIGFGAWLSGDYSAPYTMATIKGVSESSTNNINFGALVFSTRGSNIEERMRIDSSGRLLIGTTSTLRTNEKLQVDGPEGIVARGTANGGAAIVGLEAAGNSQGYTFAALNTSGALNFAVKVGGAIHSTSTSITGISDERAKENIRDLEIGLEEIIQLKPRRFDWKEGKGSNTKDSIGFIAQEVEQIGGFEVILSEWNDPDIEDAKALKMGDMLPVLVKAIQEQQATIEALTQRIETLESK